jgi:glycosyltransferase involved in cell wall biosynthesis
VSQIFAPCLPQAGLCAKTFSPFLCEVRVLILHQHFKTPSTGGAIRSYYLAKALLDHGHRAVVITADPEGQERTETYEGIEVHYVAVAYNNSFGFYARGWSFLKFVFLAGGQARRVGRIDMCYAISVPITVSIAARWMRFWRRIPYMLEIGDLWPDAPIELGFVQNALLKKFLFRIERMAYMKARALVALSPAIQKVVQSRAPGKKVHMIPNMADCDFFKPESKNTSLEQKFGVEGKFVISYLGTMGFANGLDYVLECARMSAKVGQPVHFLLVGEGALKDGLVNSAQRLGLTNVTFLPHTNRDGVKEILNVTDAVFVCYRNVPILSTGSPNKFFDGLAAGKVIVINFSGWIRSAIETSECGVYVDPAQPSGFTAAVEKLIGRSAEKAAYGARAQSLALEKFNRRRLSEEWVRSVIQSQDSYN